MAIELRELVGKFKTGEEITFHKPVLAERKRPKGVPSEVEGKPETRVQKPDLAARLQDAKKKLQEARTATAEDAEKKS